LQLLAENLHPTTDSLLLMIVSLRLTADSLQVMSDGLQVMIDGLQLLTVRLQIPAALSLRVFVVVGHVITLKAFANVSPGFALKPWGEALSSGKRNPERVVSRFACKAVATLSELRKIS
jgi:hypothetical protein